MTMRRVLVVGASSRLGGFLRTGWDGAGEFEPVWQYRRPQPGGLVWDPAESAAPLLREVEAGGPFGTMVMLAGAVPGRGAKADNAALAEMALRAAHAAEIPQVLLASSAAVYGAGCERAYAEADACNPFSDYGRDKLAMEAAGRRWRERGLEVTSLRIGNVVGADALLSHLRAGQAKRIDIYPDGRGPVRSWLGPKDWATAVADLAAASSPLPETLNLATDPPFAMDELANAAGVAWSGRPVSVDGRQFITLDTGLLRTLTGRAGATTLGALVAQWRAFGATS